jgi:hypothetical protein
VPSAHALRPSLALKLWAIERKSHIRAFVADEGLALSCGLNAVPKKSFPSDSSRITPQKVTRLLAPWHARGTEMSSPEARSISIFMPYFDEHPVVESRYLPKRSRRQPSILVFLAQDTDAQLFCYANTDIRKGEEADEIFRFVDFWKRRHGKALQHLVFDSEMKRIGLDGPLLACSTRS